MRWFSRLSLMLRSTLHHMHWPSLHSRDTCVRLHQYVQSVIDVDVDVESNNSHCLPLLCLFVCLQRCKPCQHRDRLNLLISISAMACSHLTFLAHSSKRLVIMLIVDHHTCMNEMVSSSVDNWQTEFFNDKKQEQGTFALFVTPPNMVQQFWGRCD